MKPSRRNVLEAAAAALPAGLFSAAGERPNILWITCEDLSPVLGCFGDSYARTPHLDRLAAEGVRYTRAYATASVCAPARSCLITGVHPTALGTMHLRGIMPLARQMNCFTAYLRRAGYYCSNNVKQDYNFVAPPDAWDVSSAKAHWKNRRPGQPFFSVFNLMHTHQGQIRYSREEFEKVSATLRPEERRDPALAPLPPYYPDTPLVRLNIAELYTQVTLMDRRAGQILEELKKDGLADNTIVFFFPDHGTGLPRHKRWLHESGTRVPLIIRFPERYRHLAPAAAGGVVDRLVCFEDFPPTVLRLAGVEPPGYMTGTAFLGPRAGAEREYVFATRDRVDENLLLSRSVRDRRYRYIRNYLPHRPRMEHSTYSEVGHVRRELRRLHAEGKLKGHEAWLMAPQTPPEELYDLDADPHELNNLAASPAHRQTLERLRKELRQWILRTRDAAFLPEDEMVRRSAPGNPYDLPRDRFPIERILNAAELVGRGASHMAELRRLFGDPDPAVRYWAAVGLTALGAQAKEALPELRKAIHDPAPSVRIAAAEALAQNGGETEALEALGEALQSSDSRVALQAAIVLWYLGPKAAPARQAMQKALQAPSEPPDQREYLQWCLEKTLKRLA